MLARIASILITIAVFTALHCHGHDADHGGGHGHAHGSDDGAKRPAELKLTPRFTELLRKEMRLIEAGMAGLQGALARGDAKGAARLAEKIQASYILKQSLSKDEMKQLGALLPADFIKLDGDFHARAGKLAKAARRKDFVAAGREFGRMSESCTGCHSRFARNRFPGFKK